MGNPPTVSVVIPTYNRMEYLGEAIESVLAQTYQEYEIIVVDDGSTYDINKVLAPYRDHIRYLYQQHQGPGPARNTGIRNALGKYVAFLDDDDLFEPRKLEIQGQLLEQHPALGLIYSDGYVFDTNHPDRLGLNLAVARDAPPDEFVEHFFMNTNIFTPSLLIRRQCLQEIGGFDETLAVHEDSDLILRIALKWPVKFSAYPSTKIRHHLSPRLSQDRITMNQCILQSWQKILQGSPDLYRRLGAKAEQKIADVHYALAQAYIQKRNFVEARQELALYCSVGSYVTWQARLDAFLLRLPRPALFFHVLAGALAMKRFGRRIVNKLQRTIRAWTRGGEVLL